MAILEGVVERVAFHSPDDLYTVLRVDSDQCEELATVVGCFPAPRPGEELRFYGEWVHHPTYGRQFRAEAVEPLPPRTEEGLERYLGSGLIKGVGPATARSLVQHFGSSVLEVIEREPERLLEVPGIGREKAKRIVEAVAAQGQMREAMVFLQSHGLGPRQALRIYRAYGAETVRRVQEDPYALAEEVFGIGFQTADRIARSLGVAETAPGRLRAGLLYLLRRAAEDGHVFLPAGQLLTEAARSLQVPYEAVEEALALLEEERLVVRRRSRTRPPEEEPVYLAALYAAEQGVARRLLALVRAQLLPLPVNLEAVLRRFAAETGLSLSERQREAVACAARSGVFILTGGPGTGKTTVLRAIIYALEAAGLKVALASPTGRAAKRMAEAAGREASTVHRLLEYTPLEGGGGAFQRDEDNPLEAQAVIVDEASMLDLPLTYHLLQALRPGTRLVLVGDVDQLPSVGPGNVLRDLIDSGVVETVRLREIFRQAGESLIVVNAHRINRGELPVFGEEGSDFSFWEEANPEAVRDLIVELVVRVLPGRLGCDPRTEIQVLSPMRRTAAGVESLNQALQAALNPPAPDRPEVRGAGGVLRLGDRVMQVRNNYQKDVFNGDIGFISFLDPEEQVLAVSFPGPGGAERRVVYEAHEWDEITLSYAISVHKSQGSEYPVVVLPLLTQHYLLLQRNLLYTAVTRARRCAVLVGTKQALALAVRNDRIQRRYTSLADDLRSGVLGNQPEELENSPIVEGFPFSASKK